MTSSFSFLCRASRSNPKLLHLLRPNPLKNPNPVSPFSALVRSHHFHLLRPNPLKNPNPVSPFSALFRSHHFPGPQSSNPLSLIRSRFLSAGSNTPPNPDPSSLPKAPPGPAIPSELRHQEIVGPTVERDESALANETRQTLDGLARSIYRLSSAVALLGVAHLGLGAWVVYGVRPPEEVVVQGLAAFGFPFSLAFLMRRAVKPIVFFRKMEEQGRLQILTSALQVAKNVNLLFLRARVVSFCCIIGISAGTLAVVIGRYKEGKHLVDVTEIFRLLNKEKKYRLVKLAFYRSIFFTVVYRLIETAVLLFSEEGDQLFDSSTL